MAELVDALVSNTCNFTVVSVRLRSRVQMQLRMKLHFLFNEMACVYILQTTQLDRFSSDSNNDLCFRLLGQIAFFVCNEFNFILVG